MAGSQSLKKQGLWTNWSSSSETFRGLATQLLKSMSLLVVSLICHPRLVVVILIIISDQRLTRKHGEEDFQIQESA
jgi:hypothetical protein